MNKTLYVAWQTPTPARAWFPIGRLDVESERPFYTFRYTNGALRAKRESDFKPLLAFPDLNERYESAELFPLFQNRVLSPNRKDFSDYLRWLDLDEANADPIEMLALTGGERQTDSLEVFPRIEKRLDGTFKCRFFVHGLRHLPEGSRKRAESLAPHEPLQVALEVNNPATRVALQIQTRDGYIIGWTPRYLVADLLSAISERPEVSAEVVRANEEAAPLARRILVEVVGRLPKGASPMAGPDFTPILSDTGTEPRSLEQSS